MANHLSSTFYNLRNAAEFHRGVQHMLNHIKPVGVFTGDNLITFAKSLGFLEDARFMQAFQTHVQRNDEKQLIWRHHVLCWAAWNGLRLDGDFVECACYMGTSARIVCDYTKLGDTAKSYYLYDLFEHDGEMAHHPMPAHGPDLYQQVKSRFTDVPRVVVTKGRVPEVLDSVAPSRISFMHLDLNNAAAELGALEKLFDRMTPGAVLVLDDYGWANYRQQKDVEDPFFAQRGYRVLELPTGQGLVFK